MLQGKKLVDNYFLMWKQKPPSEADLKRVAEYSFYAQAPLNLNSAVFYFFAGLMP